MWVGSFGVVVSDEGEMLRQMMWFQGWTCYHSSEPGKNAPKHDLLGKERQDYLVTQ